MFPTYISLSFVLITIYVLLALLVLENRGLQNSGFHNVTRKVAISSTLLLLYLIIQGLLSKTGIFADFSTLPPKILILPVSWLLFTFFAMLNRKTRSIIAGIPPQWLMYFQVYRIAVEWVLWRLFIEGIIPVQMTFEGYNFDIIAGLLLPITGWLVFKKKVLSVRWAIFANLVGLGLVLTIFYIAVRSAPGPIGADWEDPVRNTMIAYWPMIWLPGLVAPAAIMIHVFSLWQLFLINRKLQTFPNSSGYTTVPETSFNPPGTSSKAI